MKVLFIGGTGIISSACTRLAVARGFDVTLLNRGQSKRAVPAGASVVTADIRDPRTVAAALQDEHFDAVVNFITYTPEQVEQDIHLFRGRTDQYVFISSTAVYQSPPPRLPITESSPLKNNGWDYAVQKIACEERLVEAYRSEDFPVTVVRPGHTYDETKTPLRGDYTVIHRMRQGKKVVVPGDGTSVWVMTANTDFAKGLVGLLGNQSAVGESFHITSDEVLSWNQIYAYFGLALRVPVHFAPISSELITAFLPDWKGTLWFDKSHSKSFDNSKIKRFVPDFAATVPFSRGAAAMVEWFLADPARQVVDTRLDSAFDRMIQAYESAFPDLRENKAE